MQCSHEGQAGAFCSSCGAKLAPTLQPLSVIRSGGPSISRIAIGVALGIVLLFGLAVVLEIFAEASHMAATANKRYSVAYMVTSGVPGEERLVSVLVNNEKGGTSDFKVVTPWKYETDNFAPGAFLYVSAQNQEEEGSIKAEIYVDGSLVKSSTSEGEFSIATASNLPP